MKILSNWTLSFQHDKPLRNLSNKRGQKMHDQGKVEKTVFWLMVLGVARDNIKWNTGSRWQAWQQQELQLSTHIDLEDEREIVNYKWSSPFILSKPALHPLQYLLQQDHAPTFYQITLLLGHQLVQCPRLWISALMSWGLHWNPGLGSQHEEMSTFGLLPSLRAAFQDYLAVHSLV